MKHKLALATIALLLLSLCASCTGAGAILHPALEPERLESRSRQYGQTDAVVLSQDAFSYVVLYPITGLPALDEAVYKWAQMAVNDAVDLKSMTDDGRLGGELLVSYDSYLLSDRFVSVALTGSYVSRGSSPPVNVVSTFNYDLLGDRIIRPIELIPFTSHPQMFDLIGKKLLELAPDIDVAALGINSLWLEPIVLTQENVRLIISSEGGPLSALGKTELVFGYDELEGILFLPGTQEAVMQAEPPALPVEAEPVPTQPEEIDLQKPMLALSFDDGPSEITGQILDLLERYNVPATFFIIGRQVPDYPETISRMAEQGCELASHTWDHPELNKLGRDAVLEQIDKTADAIEAAAGVRPVFLRPPYGAANANVKEIMAERGYYLINWSIDTLDWKTRNAQAVYEHIMENAKDGGIILCHDLYKSTLEAMEMAIPALLEQGYQLVTVGQLLGLEEGQMAVGTIYRHR